MAVNAPAPKNVKAGEPVTAEAWNTIVDAINAVVQFINSSEASSLRVVIKNADITGARVAAIHGNFTAEYQRARKASTRAPGPRTMPPPPSPFTPRNA